MKPPIPDEENTEARWNPVVLARLDAFVADCARELAGGAPGPRAPFAVFDWDHTLFHGDIGDAVFLHLVKNRLLIRPAAWTDTCPFLTREAREALDLATTSAPLQPDNPELARELVSMYFWHRTLGGQAAFEGYDPDWTHPSYAWCAALLAGRRADEVAGLTRDVLAHLGSRPPGARGSLAGLDGWDDWGRFTGPMIRLAARLQEAGLPVWIVSASPQTVVETCALAAGLSPRGVIGVRNRTDPAGVLLPGLEPCGDLTDVIPYGLGKRAWIHRVLGERGARHDRQADEAPGELWFAAGDSDGDLAFLQDAARLRLVIHHRENRSVRLARQNADGRWLLNPPFFEA